MSTRGRYGLRAIIDMAIHQEQGPVSLREIASRQNLSENYLEHLVASLRRGNLLNSVRGPMGGYYLARNPDSITLGEIIRILEGPIAPVECSLSQEEKCASPEDCFVHRLWQNLSREVNEIFDKRTLGDLLEDAHSYKNIEGCFKFLDKEDVEKK